MLLSFLRWFKWTPTVALFGMPMGLLGLGLNAEHFAEAMRWQSLLPDGILVYGYIALLMVSVSYFGAWLWSSQHRGQLKEEWLHPQLLTLFPSVTLTLMLACLGLYQYGVWLPAVLGFYYLVLAGHTLLLLAMVSRWLFDAKIEIEHLSPTWFILLSGNFVVVITGMTFLPVEWREGLWFYFSISLFLWTVLVVSLWIKLFFTQGLALQTLPTLFIFMAPPSLGTVATLLLLGGEANLIAWFFYSFATIMMLVWLWSHRVFMQSDLSMVAWAYVYPLSAYGLASQYMADALQAPFLWWWSGVVFLVVLGFVILLSTWLLKQAFIASPIQISNKT